MGKEESWSQLGAERPLQMLEEAWERRLLGQGPRQLQQTVTDAADCKSKTMFFFLGEGK